jgi:hypothetical protein
MSDDTERSVASAGSQPVAWAVEFEGEVEPFCLSFDKSKAINEAGGVGRVFPLWRSPTLTDEEREAISAAACICEDAGRADIAVIINTALERLG